MPHALLVRGARQLITLRGPSVPRRGMAAREIGVVVNGALLIRGGRIVEAGPARRIENLSASRQALELDADGRIVLPGFIDAHTHPACAAVGWNAPAAGRDELAVKALRAMQASRLEAVARSTAAAMLRHGTTAMDAKSGFGLDAAGELKTLRVLRRLEHGPWDVVRTFRARAVPAGAPAASHAAVICELLPKVARRGLAHYAEVNAGAFPGGLSRLILRAAADAKMPVRVEGDAALAVEADAVSVTAPRAAPGHAEALARSGVIATLLPGCAGQMRGSDLVERGAAVALATGYGPGAPSTWSLQEAVAAACREAELAPEEAITAVTANAAHALGLASRIGTLEPGKQADLVLLNCSDYREIPYHFGVNHVHLTMKLGAVVYREGSAGHWPEAW